MKTIYYRYELWEDYQNGMFHKKEDGKFEERKQKAIEFFKDLQVLYEKMKYVAKNWKHSAEMTFTNPSINYQAWLGQASNCYYTGCSDDETIEVWHLLSDEERENANKIADKVYWEWIEEYKKTKENYQYTIFDMEVKYG